MVGRKFNKGLCGGVVLSLLWLYSSLFYACEGAKTEEKKKEKISDIAITEDEIAIKDSELRKEIEASIESMTPPKSISVKKLTKDDIKKLNPVPPEEGGAFKAREGDILVETDKIRVVIQAPSREIGPFTYGGNIIDADIRDREDGRFHDVLGEENIFWFLGQTLKPQKIGVLKDNVVVAVGKLDILDYINANALANLLKRFVPTFQFKFKIDADIPVKVYKYFVFGDGRAVKIINVVCNESDKAIPYFFFADLIDSGGDGEFFIPSSTLKGYGYKTRALFGLGLFKGVSLSFVSEKLDVSYGIFPEEGDDNLVFIVAGVAVFGYNVLENNDPFLTLVNIATGDSKKFLEIDPGKCLMKSKYFIVGNGSASSLQDEFFRIMSEKEGINIHEVTGRIKVGDMRALPKAKGFTWRGRVAVFDEKNNLITTATTDDNGNFKLTLPEGKYKFIAEIPSLPPSEPVDVSVPTNSKVEFDLGKPAKVVVEVFEKTEGGRSTYIPAKVSFVCEGECPKKICVDPEECEVLSTSFRDYVYDPLPEGVQAVSFLANGERTEIWIPPGTYRVVISRGMEYSRWEQSITVGAGEIKEITAYLMKVADAKGWISTDTHVHAVNSPDSPVALIDRVITFAAEGVDVIISTDHDWLTDYEPTIELVGIKKFLASLVGQEITTFSYGHFNAFPVRRSPGEPNDGALDWVEKYDRAEKYNIPESEREKYRFLRSLHPTEIFERAHLMKPENFSVNIVQVNHPRSGGMGYFDMVLLDTVTLKTKENPCVHRIFPPLGQCGSAEELNVDDTGLFPSIDVLKDMQNIKRFDAIEVYNAFSEIKTVMNDWFTFLNHGIHVTATGVSDTHQKIAVQSGIARTFVKVSVSDDSPSAFRENINIRKEFVENLKDGKVFVTNGIILEEFKVCGLPQGGTQEICAEMGRSEMKNISSSFEVRLKVKSADWVDFDTVRIYINTQGTGAKARTSVQEKPKPHIEIKVTPNIQEKNVDGITFRWRELEIVRDINPPGDSDFWVVVEVSCSEKKCGGNRNPMFPVVVNRSVLPILITNPVYVDIDGDGNFSPSKPSYSSASPKVVLKKVDKQAMEVKAPERRSREKADMIHALKEVIKNFLGHRH